MRVADLCRLIRDDHIAEERDRRAKPGGGAIHPAEDRLLHLEQRYHDLLGVPADGAEALRLRDLFLEPVEIPARAEGPALCRQDYEIAFAVALEAVEDERKLGVHLLVHSVHGMA
jgi:hypothetical protein